jgi:hypothetical protein
LPRFGGALYSYRAAWRAGHGALSVAAGSFELLISQLFRLLLLEFFCDSFHSVA